MDYNSDVTTSSIAEVNSQTDPSISKISSSESFEEVNSHYVQPKNNSLFMDEDHFSIHSDIDFLDEIDIRLSNLSIEEQLEATLSKYVEQLRSLSAKDLTDSELDVSKKSIVKRICDLKVKLAKLKEDEEFEDALKCQQVADDLINGDLLDDYPIIFKRTYSFSKIVAGHKLVLSTDIYENEKRLRTIWKTYLKNSHSSSPLSLSPVSTNSFLPPTVPTFRLLNLLTSNHVSYLTSACTNWTGTSSQITDPLSQLICDQCFKKSTKSLNDIFCETFKIGKKSEIQSPQFINLQNDINKNSNSYLVCIYCYFTIHYNCLSRNIRKCPKIFFDNEDEELISDHYAKFYNLIPNYLEKKSVKEISKQDDSISVKSEIIPCKNFIDRHQIRMRKVILKICPEVGLSKQDFRCADCRVLLSISKSNTKAQCKPRLCDYSGLYFCENCHFGDTAVIPARVIHNWDFQPQPVSRISLQIISYLRNTLFHFDRPVLINFVEINSMLYGLVDELIQVKRLRSELSHIYKYISLCKQPSKPRQWIAIMSQLGSHLLDDNQLNYLSFTDICDLKSLVSNLSELESLFIIHITSCESCKGKGFFCELCPKKDDILFPFSPNTTICTKCNAVYHKNCFFRRNKFCPRCNRIENKNVQRVQECLLNDENENSTVQCRTDSLVENP